MSKEEQHEPSLDTNDYDINHLLEYKGPNYRQQDPIPDGVGLLDYRNSDKNEQNISILLSSQGIPFNIEIPKLGWTGTQIRMIVTVPKSLLQQAMDILTAAVKVGAVDIVEGTEGLITYYH